jgi:diguanylate cyclase (GGDEF)-like protein
MFQMKTTILYDKNNENNGSVVLIYDISEWKRSQKQLTDLATIDYLTGIYNRQHFIHLAQQELLRCAKNRQRCSVLIMDVDHFKLVNDTYGHQAGDRVLKHVMDLCRKNFRRVDILGRYGGEEFVVLLPEISQEDVLVVAERVRLAIHQSPFITPDASINVSISLGVAIADPEKLQPLDQLLDYADRALYTSKQKGRNMVSVYDP